MFTICMVALSTHPFVFVTYMMQKSNPHVLHGSYKTINARIFYLNSHKHTLSMVLDISMDCFPGCVAVAGLFFFSLVVYSVFMHRLFAHFQMFFYS